MEHKAEKVWKNLVWQDRGRMSGAPCIYGTRIRIEDLFNWLAGGGSLEEFLQAYPHVKRETVVAILELAKEDFLKEFDVA